MTLETWLLVAWFSGAGPAITQFETRDLCESAKQAIAEIYWPDAFDKTKSSWTVDSSHIASYRNTQCIPISGKE
jgi:hypothetical protein